MADTAPPSAQDIRAARNDNPKLRARDLADRLGISEAELVAAHLGRGATRIAAQPDAIMAEVPRLGEVMALTRTPSCLHEKLGAYGNYHPGEQAAMIVNGAIDLRLFPAHWILAFAVEEPGEAGPRRSLQVFDEAGDAVHKIHLRAGSNHAAWADVVAALALEDQSGAITVSPRMPSTPPIERPDRADDLRRDWDAMTDTHQFVQIVRRLKTNRLGAYRVAGAPYVRRLEPVSVDRLLHRLAETGVPMMLFVGNHGCIQIHSGPIETLKPVGPWLNVMDPGFNLHLRADQVAEVWQVRKPTRRGMAVSVEAFDAGGGIILQAFGMRTKAVDRTAEFEALVAGLPTLETEVVA